MTASKAPTPKPSRRRVSQRRLTIGLCINVVAIAFETIAVATAMPVAARELNGLPYYAWSFSLFLIGMLFATVVTGRLSDRIGPAKPLLVGLGSSRSAWWSPGTAESHGPAGRRPAGPGPRQRSDQHGDLRLRRPGLQRDGAAADVHLHLHRLGRAVLRRPAGVGLADPAT